MVNDQEDHRSNNRDEQAVGVQSTYASRSKHMEQPASDKSTDDSQQHALAAAIGNLATDEPGDQAKDYPRKERHRLHG